MAANVNEEISRREAEARSRTERRRLDSVASAAPPRRYERPVRNVRRTNAASHDPCPKSDNWTPLPQILQIRRLKTLRFHPSKFYKFDAYKSAFKNGRSNRCSWSSPVTRTDQPAQSRRSGSILIKAPANPLASSRAAARSGSCNPSTSSKGRSLVMLK
jgi:hypothetical protein